MTQCIIDIKANTYAPSTSAVLATGGEVEPLLDETTGQPVQLFVKDEQVVKPGTTITFKTDDGKTQVVTPTAPASTAPASTLPAADAGKSEPAKPAENPPDTKSGGVLSYIGLGGVF